MKLAKPILPPAPPPDPAQPAEIECVGTELAQMYERQRRGEFFITAVRVRGARYTCELSYPWFPDREPLSPWKEKRKKLNYEDRQEETGG